MISLIASAASVFVITRILGPEKYGLYSISTVIPSLLLTFIDLGIGDGVIKYAASLRVKKEEARIASLVVHGLAFKIVLGLIATLACFSFSEFFAEEILKRPEISPYVQIASTAILLQAIYTSANSVFVGIDKTEYYALLTDAQAITRALSSALLVILGLEIAGVLFGSIVGSLVASVMGIIILYKICRSLTGNLGPSNEHFSGNLKLLVKYGFPLYLSALLSGVVLQYQNIMLAIFTSNDDLGNFKAAMNFVVLANTLAISITTALFPAFAKLESKEMDIQEFLAKTVKYTSMAILPVATLFILYAKEIVQLVYGEGYESAEVFLCMYAMQFYLVGSGQLVLRSLFNGFGETKVNLKVTLVYSAIMFPLTPILTGYLGVKGMIITILLASTISAAYALRAGKSKFKIKLDARAVTRVYLVSLVSSVPILAFQRIPLTSSPVRLLLGIAMYLSVYLLLMPMTKTITRPEMEQIRTIVEKTKPLKYIAQPFFRFVEIVLSRTA